ncbi:MAG TPA: tRNA (guanosine(18)-2'-O)-methyltransferase TrmH [Gammaproteobacteria bacterium]|nr:tRNA (guanosine(18)-2'-O)-methyltransferase TrmH [Gammaproteobacteria bacterium]
MTPKRYLKLRGVLDRRQPDLTVLLDNVHKTHNFSAVVRSCDAVGAFEAHAVWPNPRLEPNHMSSGGTGKWVRVCVHPDLNTAASALRDRGMQIVAAHLDEGANDYRRVDFTRPTAILLGAELDGVSKAGLSLADIRVAVPMAGMVQSLNVSVAAAILLFEAQRQREAAGLYERPRLDPEVYARTLFEWCHPEVAEHCRRNSRPYPPLDENGEISGPLR